MIFFINHMHNSNELLTTVIQNAIYNKHRLFFVVRNNRNIAQIYDKLANNTEGNQNYVLWLYKSEIDTTIIKQIKSDVTTIKYTDSDRILGCTYNMLVIQDYEAVTPNILAKSIETVKGGGIIVLITHDIIESEMECADVTRKCKRYNKRLYKSMKKNESILFFDECFQLKNKEKYLYNGQKNLKLNENKVLIEEIKKTKIDVTDIREKIANDLIENFYKLTVTDEQNNILKSLENTLEDRNCKTVISITAARGRGKSAALGLISALAVKKQFSTIFIASPSIENVKTLFDFIIKGLEKLEYKEKINYEVNKITSYKKKYINKIIINKKYKQIIEYVNPYDELQSLPDLLIIDEAAAIPIPHIQKLLKCNLVFMASTINGYEGTGRSLTYKLFNELKLLSNSKAPFFYKELQMTIPIRYSENDPIENWLNEALLLNTKAPVIRSMPSLNDCKVYLVNKDVLFSYHSESEIYLKNLMSLFITSHYKNSPDDLMIMADTETHEIFTFITPSNDSLPQIICAVQVSYEGKVDKKNIKRDGNLIPWTIFDNYLLEEFLNYTGIRIVRIAVHPEFMRMGYGNKMIEELYNHYFNTDVATITNKPNNALLINLKDVVTNKFDYFGTSFGATEELINFWKKCNFIPIYTRQTPSLITGDYSIIMIRSDNINYESLYNIHMKRLFYLFSSVYKNLKPTLCLSMFYSRDMNIRSHTLSYAYFDAYDVKRIESYCKGECIAFVIGDLFSKFSELYFLGFVQCNLSILQQCVILLIGCQHKTINETSFILGVDNHRVESILHKTILSIYLNYKNNIEALNKV